MGYVKLSEDAVKLGVKELNRYKRDAKRFGQPAVVSVANIALDYIAVSLHALCLGGCRRRAIGVWS